MVYAVAAYSITLAALLVYGLLLQHRIRIARARQGPVSPEEWGRGFHLGAALLAPVWALAHGQRAVGVTLAASTVACAAASGSGLRLVALLLGSLLLGAGVFFGVVGNRLAVADAASRSSGANRPVDALAAGGAAEELARRQLVWSLAGAILYTVVLPWAWYFLRGADAV